MSFDHGVALISCTGTFAENFPRSHHRKSDFQLYHPQPIMGLGYYPKIPVLTLNRLYDLSFEVTHHSISSPIELP